MANKYTCRYCKKDIASKKEIYYDEDNLEDYYHLACLYKLYEDREEHERDMELMGY